MNSLTSRLIRVAILGGTLIAAGCSHVINLTPPLNTLEATEIVKMGKTVGYYISPADRAKKVTTPGGGGDKVTYTPYADAEPALRDVLQRVFGEVVDVPSLDDKLFLTNQSVAYVFVPTFSTTSSSSSAFTWPPTNFEIEIACKAVDANGATVWQTSVTGKGEAVFDDFKHDFSLAARRAAKAAFLDLQAKINAAPEFR